MHIKICYAPYWFVPVRHFGLRYLGTVQIGLEIGALAVTPEGGYVRVNGHDVTPLQSDAVRTALSLLKKSRPRKTGFADSNPPALVSADERSDAETRPSGPLVIRKKVRRVVNAEIFEGITSS